MALNIRTTKFAGVLLASDYDGTLVPETKHVTEGVKAALRYFIDQGGLFTVCTGRCHKGFHSYSPEYINAPVLLANGGMAYDYAKGEIVFDDGIGEEGVCALRDAAERFPELSVELYPFEKGYAIHPTDAGQRHFTSQSIPFDIILDPSEAPRPWSKAMLGGNQASIQKAQAFLRSFHPEVSFLPTDGAYLEVLKKGVNKGSALMRLAGALGVRQENVCAAGDGYNDVEMLKAASKAFVPENGDEAAKACASYIVRSNEADAIAHVVEILDALYA